MAINPTFLNILVCSLLGYYVAQCSKPLFLTPYIDKGLIREAQAKSLVNSSLISGNFPKVSHAGYITVNKTLGNHLFFWFFPCERGDSFAPLLIWLNGGPGVSAMCGLVYENGPIQMCKDCDHGCYYTARNSSWTKWFSMLYIDSPVGVGYSFTESGAAGERVTQENVSLDLYSFVEQFYQMFPAYRKIDLYIGGQSYAGKYVSFLGHRIHVQRQRKLSDIPLTGIYIGGPFFDPPTQCKAFFTYLYSVGAISHNQMLVYQAKVAKLFEKYHKGQLESLNGSEISNLLVPELGSNAENYAKEENFDTNNQKISEIMTCASVREAIHVGNASFTLVSSHIFNRFGFDILVSAKSKLAILMDHYKVLIYTGDLDVIVSSVMVEAALLSTPWSNLHRYSVTSRLPWWSSSRNQPQLRGFYTSISKFCRVMVRGAGHQTPTDQPEATLDMMTQFVRYGCIRGDGVVPRKRYHRIKKGCKAENDRLDTLQQLTGNCTHPII